MNDNPKPNRPDPTEALHEALRHTQPEARPEFRRALENQLVARIMDISPSPFPAAQPAEERTTPMSMTASPEIPMALNGHAAHFEAQSAPESDMPSIETLTDVRHFRRFTLPLTLVAALLIGLLIFPTLMSMRDKNGSTGALPPAFNVNPQVASPTPQPIVEIVVAARHISRGQEITADDVKIVAWYERYVPISVMTDPAQIIGQFARTDIYKESPILQTVLGTSPADAAQILDSLPPHLTVEVVVAMQPVAAGTILEESMVAIRLYHRFAMPPGTFTEPDEVIGQRALTDLYREMPIIDTQIGVAYRTYTMQEGDYPALISEKYGVSIEGIFELNNLDASSSLLLQVGDTLLLPSVEDQDMSMAAGGLFPVGMVPIAIPLNRLTNETENTGDGTDLVEFVPGSKVAIIHNRPNTGMSSTSMSVVVPSASLISAELEVFAEGYASFVVGEEEAEALNEILSGSDDLFTLYAIPETQPESAPVVIVVTATPAPTTTPEILGSLLPIGTRMVALPMDRFSSVAYALQPGDRVDIVHTPSDSGEPRIVVQEARVVYIGEFPADGSIIGFAATPVAVGTPDANEDFRPSIVALAVSPDEAEVLTALLEANESLTFLLRPAGQSETRETFDLPLDSIVNPEALPQVGDFVDVYATLWFVDIDDEFQRVVPETESALKTTQVVAQNAEVIALDEASNKITLAVSGTEKVTLQHIAVWRPPITIVPSRLPSQEARFGYGPRTTLTPTPSMTPMPTLTPTPSMTPTPTP